MMETYLGPSVFMWIYLLQTQSGRAGDVEMSRTFGDRVELLTLARLRDLSVGICAGLLIALRAYFVV